MNQSRPWTALDASTLVLAIALAPVGLVLGVIGLRRARRDGVKNRRATAALLISVGVIVATVAGIAVSSAIGAAREQAFQREYFCTWSAKYPDLFSNDGLRQELLVIAKHDEATLVPYLHDHSADLTTRLDSWRNLVYDPPGEIKGDVGGVYDTLDRTVTNLSNGVVLPLSYLDKAPFAVDRLDRVKAWVSSNCSVTVGK